MNRHLLHALLASYPRAWRDRYGAELASLTQDLISAGEITPLSAVVNLAGGAAREWGRVLAGSRRAVAATALAAIMAVAGSFYLASLVRPPSRPASVRSVPAPAAASAPGVAVALVTARPGAYSRSAPCLVAVSPTSVPEEDYGLSRPSPSASPSALSSCGPTPSPVAVSPTAAPEEDYGLSTPSPSASASASAGSGTPAKP